jgi:hypothetical protein
MRPAESLPATATRVAERTDPDVNCMLRDRADAEISRLENAAPEEFHRRLVELDEEWDVERILQFNFSLASATGVMLGLRDPRWLLLPAAVYSFFLQHALHGWCPPLPVFRRLGFRTMREIEWERFALKVLRGDFDGLPARGAASLSERAKAVLRAVDA